MVVVRCIVDIQCVLKKILPASLCDGRVGSRVVQANVERSAEEGEQKKEQKMRKNKRKKCEIVKVVVGFESFLVRKRCFCTDVVNSCAPRWEVVKNLVCCYYFGEHIHTTTFL